MPPATFEGVPGGEAPPLNPLAIIVRIGVPSLFKISKPSASAAFRTVSASAWPGVGAYVRGEALLAMRRYAEAAAEFQKILDHRGIVGLDPIGVLAHWRLGRAYVLSGDNAKGKSEYQAFLGLWKDADYDIPILNQAKTEYAKLQ